MTTGGIISPADGILGEGNGGDINPLEYFKKTSLSSGTQEGNITLKPLYLNSELFPEEFIPYDILITASGVAIVAGQDSLTSTTKIISYKIQKLENSIEFVDELDLEDDLNLQNDYTVLIKVGNYCYLKGVQGTDKIAKIYVNDFGNMEKISIFYDPLYTKFSSMFYYNGYLIVSSLDTAAGDPKIYIINTEGNMSFFREVLPTDKNNFDSIISMEITGNYIVCLSNKPGNIKSLIIIDATNILESISFDVVSKTNFTVQNGIVRAMYLHDETVYAIGVGECQIIGIASKKNPILYGTTFLTGTSITYGVTVLGDYAFFISWNFDNIICFNIKDFYNPQQVDVPVVSSIYLNAVVRIRSYGPYLITISQSASTTKNIAAWHNNGYSVPSIKTGTGLFLGKTYFNDDILVAKKALFENKINGYSAEFVSEVRAANIPKSLLNVRRLEDLPPVTYIEKSGNQSDSSTEISNIPDTADLEPFMIVIGTGLKPNTYITAVTSPNTIEINQLPDQSITGNVYQIDSHIDLEPLKGREIEFDSNGYGNFVLPYYLKPPITGSIAFHTLGETRFIYSGIVGGAIRGTLSADTFIAILGKFLAGQLYPMGQFFDINGDPEATVFTENMVSFQTPSSHFALGRIDDVNITNQVSQFKHWSTGLASNNPKKLKPSKWSFRDGYIGHTMDVACFYFKGILDNLADMVGNDFTPNDSRQYFVYIEPSMAAAAAVGGTEFVFRGCNMKGPKNQYWFPGSAKGSDVGVDVRGCQPLSDSSSFYVATSSAAIGVLIAPDTTERIPFSNLVETDGAPIERFNFEANNNEINYIGIQDKLHNLNIKGKFSSGASVAIDFSLCVGNYDINIINIIQGGPIFEFTTDKPHGLTSGDIVFFENPNPTSNTWKKKIAAVAISDNQFSVLNSTGTNITSIDFSKQLSDTLRTITLDTSPTEYTFERKLIISHNDYVLLSAYNSTGTNRAVDNEIGTILSAERI